jgi:hypothetical protein
MKHDAAERAALDLSHDAVSVALAVGERDQDFEGHWRQRQKGRRSEPIHMR